MKYLVKANANVEIGGGISIKEAGGIPKVGDEFEVDEERFNALSTDKNAIGVPLVDLVSTKEEPKATLEDKPKKKGEK